MSPTGAALEAILARLPWIALTIENGSVTWMNGQEAFGWPASSLMDGTLSLLWHPEDREEAHRLREQAAQGRPHASILRVVTRQGDARWVEVEMSAVQQDTCLVTLLDITERVRVQERATQAEREIALFGEFAQDLLCLTDVDHRVTWASGSVRRLLGWDPQELIGTYLADLVHPDDRQAMHPQSASEGEDAYLRLRTRAGGYCWMTHLEHGPSEGAKINAFMEVDALVRSHEEVQLHARRLEEILDALPVPHLLLAPVLGPDGEGVDFRIADANQEALDFLAEPAQEVIGSPVGRIMAGSGTGLLDRLRLASPDDRPLVWEDWQVDRGDSQARRIELHAAAVTGGLSLTWREVSDDRSGRERLQDAERRYRLLAENSSDAVVWLRDGVIKWTSVSVTSMLGWAPDEWAGRRLEEFVHVDDLGVFRPLRMVTEDPAVSAGQASARFRIRSKSLSYRWVQAQARPFVDLDGRLDGAATSLRIVDAEVEAMRELDHRARTDELTGLMNRREALQRISSMGANSRRSGQGIAVLFCDVDRFKAINDRLGHAVGDVVLRTLAHRVAACVRGGDFAARVGGDEILVVLDGVHGIADALDIAEKIRVAASMPMDLMDAIDMCAPDRQASVTMSIGVVHVTSAQDVGDAVARADAAMYRAKRNGANRVFCLHQEQVQAC